MAKTVTPGFTDTAGVTAKTVQMPAINFQADYSVASESNSSTGSEVVMLNSKAAFDQPTSIRVARRNVSDVYKGSNVPVGLMGVVRTGVQALVESRFTYKVTESTTGAEYVLPCKVGITIQIPQDGNLSSSYVLTMVQRAIAALFEEGDNTDARLGGLVRGVLKPAAVK